jgi:two-component system chemotaxis response regulator CheB
MRPAIDPLIRSAARVYGSRVVAVVLSGAMHDGIAGLLAVRSAGGLNVVQDPADALAPSLPRTARDIAGADYVVSSEKLAALLVELVHRPRPEQGSTNMNEPLEKLQDAVIADSDAQVRGDRRGRLTVFTCPECGGSLWQVDEKKLVRFRCHVGHVYEGEALLTKHTEALEAAL